MLYAQKVRYTAQTVRMMSEPTCDPTVSVSSPISGGDDRASADARNHQARNFIGLVRAAAQCQRVDDREDAREGEGEDAHTNQYLDVAVGEIEHAQRREHHDEVYAQVADVRETRQQECADECAGRTAEEIDARSESCVGDFESAAFDQQFGRQRVHAYVETYGAEDADEEEQDMAVLQQRERCADRTARL